MSRIRAEGVSRSILDRLKAKAVERRQSFSEILELYAIERFLYRLSKSRYRDRILLKGALLLRYWIGGEARPTRDIDLSASGQVDIPEARRMLQDLWLLQVVDDGIAFDPTSLEVRPNRPESPVAGLRANFAAHIGNVQLRYQVDIGLDDAVVPSAAEMAPDSILGLPVMLIKSVTPYTAVAEKTETLVVLGSANSRMKDYYDLCMLSRNLAFDGKILKEAILATFHKRRTLFPDRVPDGLSEMFANDPANNLRWNTFMKRQLIGQSTEGLISTIRELKGFVLPVLQAAGAESAFLKTWPPGGPWQ